MSYQDVATKAKKLINENGDSETLRLTVGEAIREAPTDQDRDYWRAVADQLAKGRSVKTKELE